MEQKNHRNLTQAELVAALNELGYTDVTVRRIADWRANDLLPPFDMVGSGRGRRLGRECSAWTHGADVLKQAKQVYELLKIYGAFGDLYLPLWILGFSVPPRRIREGLRRPLETASDDVAVEVDGRNAIEDLIDDAA